jgi:multidrug efflux pump
MLKHTEAPTKGFFSWFNRGFAAMTRGYGRSVGFVIRYMFITLLLFSLIFVGIYYMFKTIPTSFVPNEDQGYVLAQVLLPDSSSLERTIEATTEIDKFFANNPAVVNRTIINGYSLIDGQYLTNAATFFVTLKDFKERYASVATAMKENPKVILGSLYGWSKENLDAGMVIPISPPPIPGIGTSSGFEFWVQDKGSGEPAELYDVVQKFLEKARQRPELAGLNSTFRASTLQLKADVNRDMAMLLGVPVSDVYNALQAQFGSIQASQYEQYSRVWNVVMQSDAPFRQKPQDITKLYTRSQNNQMIPLSAMVTTDYTRGPALVPHFNGFPSAQITGSAADGYSSGDAIIAMEQVAREMLPQGYDFAWSGMALQEKESGSSSTIAFAFGLLIVFLILAAQYESWSLPMSVLTAVPFGIIGALLATYWRGLENDVYFQIGLLVLVGLAAKNAILIVEFAVELRHKGKGIIESAVEAGELRLRPIIMTSLAFIFGVLPLYFAMGAGANARHSIGTGIIGGMIGASTLALMFVPLFFYLFERLRESVSKKETPKDDH